MSATSSASYFLTMDKVLLEQVGFIDNFDVSVHIPLMNCGLKLLEDIDIGDELKAISETAQMPPNKLMKLCTAISALMWECYKFGSRNQQFGMLKDILLQSGLSDAVVGAFYEAFHNNRHRLQLLKGSLGISAYSYSSLSWRLEVELAKRSMAVMSNPKYLLRLELENPAQHQNQNDPQDSSIPVHQVVHHLQADYATMKMVELELQRAADEVNNIHCQRIKRYMS